METRGDQKAEKTKVSIPGYLKNYFGVSQKLTIPETTELTPSLTRSSLPTQDQEQGYGTTGANGSWDFPEIEEFQNEQSNFKRSTAGSLVGVISQGVSAQNQGVPNSELSSNKLVNCNIGPTFSITGPSQERDSSSLVKRNQNVSDPTTLNSPGPLVTLTSDSPDLHIQTLPDFDSDSEDCIRNAQASPVPRTNKIDRLIDNLEQDLQHNEGTTQRHPSFSFSSFLEQRPTVSSAENGEHMPAEKFCETSQHGENNVYSSKSSPEKDENRNQIYDTPQQAKLKSFNDTVSQGSLHNGQLGFVHDDGASGDEPAPTTESGTEIVAATNQVNTDEYHTVSETQSSQNQALSNLLNVKFRPELKASTEDPWCRILQEPNTHLTVQNEEGQSVCYKGGCEIDTFSKSISIETDLLNSSADSVKRSMHSKDSVETSLTESDSGVFDSGPSNLSAAFSSSLVSSPTTFRTHTSKHRRKTSTPVHSKCMSTVLEKITMKAIEKQSQCEWEAVPFSSKDIPNCSTFNSEQNDGLSKSQSCVIGTDSSGEIKELTTLDTTTEIQHKPLCSKLFTSHSPRKVTASRVPKLMHSFDDLDSSDKTTVPLTTNRYRRHFLKQFRRAEAQNSASVAQASSHMLSNSNVEIPDQDASAVDDCDELSNSMQIDESVVESDDDDYLFDGKRMKFEDLQNMESFHCKVCDKRFNSAGMLMAHFICHNQVEKEQVDFSDMLPAQTGAQVHPSSHHQPSVFQCHVCDKTFLKPFLLQVHLKSHPPEPGPSSSSSSLSVGREHVCPVCGKTFATAGALSLHKRAHTGSNPYTCQECGKNFRDKTRLTTHIRVHTGEKPFSCDFCGKSFSQKGNLKLHQKIHSGEKPCKCDICGQGFRQKNDLVRHWRTHSVNQSNDCPVCTATFPSPGELKEHLKSHGVMQKDAFNEMTGVVAESGSKFPNRVKKVYRCEECNFDFVSFPEFQKHLECHKDGRQAKVACNICGKELNGENFLDHMHMHTGEKPYTCIYCGKYFRRSHHLQTHLRTHTGDKPYICDDCGKCFARGDHLANHRRTHTGEKPYTCDQCGKCYSQSHHLLRHKRTHTGEKPYHCQLCEKRFSRDHHLKKHMETHRVVIFREEEEEGGEEEEQQQATEGKTLTKTFNTRQTADYLGVTNALATGSMVTRSSGRIAQMISANPESNIASRLIESMVQKHLAAESTRVDFDVNSVGLYGNTTSDNQNMTMGLSLGDFVQERLTKEFEAYAFDHSREQTNQTGSLQNNKRLRSSSKVFGSKGDNSMSAGSLDSLNDKLEIDIDSTHPDGAWKA